MILLFNKPFDVLCQFTANPDQQPAPPTLANYIDMPGYYAAGRLDKDSEGLLLLTNNGRLQHRISHPKHKSEKHYWVQVDGDITQDAIQALRQGVKLNDGMTLPARVEKIPPPAVWERIPPVRYRKHIPTSWLAIILKEGRNRQIRRMTAHTGFPTLRIIRHQIGKWRLGNISPGQFVLLTK